jgi:hypothetical protein
MKKGRLTFKILQDFDKKVLFKEICVKIYSQKPTKQTPRPLFRKRTIPTDRPPLIDEI